MEPSRILVLMTKTSNCHGLGVKPRSLSSLRSLATEGLMFLSESSTFSLRESLCAGGAIGRQVESVRSTSRRMDPKASLESPHRVSDTVSRLFSFGKPRNPGGWFGVGQGRFGLPLVRVELTARSLILLFRGWGSEVEISRGYSGNQREGRFACSCFPLPIRFGSG